MRTSTRTSFVLGVAGAALLVLAQAPPVQARFLSAAASSAAPRFNAAAAAASQYPCTSATPYGAVLVSAANWDGQIQPNTGHDGATFDVFSNYKAGRSPAACAGGIVGSDTSNRWDTMYQCTELAIRVADGEWAVGDRKAWTNAGWNGNADDMFAHHPPQLTAIKNGSGSLPVPGDLMVWSSGGGSDPGHVAVVSAVGGGSVTFVGENQGAGMVSLAYSGSTVQNAGWKAGSSITGWLGPTNAPAVGATTGQQIVFWQGFNQHLYETWFANGAWNGPVDWTAGWTGTVAWSTSANLISSPTFAIDGSTQIVFWEGANGHIWEAWFTGRWNGPVDQTTNAWHGAGLPGSAPTAMVLGGQQILFWRGVDGHLWEAWYSNGWNGPVDWTASWNGLGPLASAPSVAASGSQQLVFWRGVNGHMWEAWFTGSWHGPVDLTSAWGSAPAPNSAPGVAVDPSSGDQFVFYQGFDGHLWLAEYIAGLGWDGPFDMTASWSGTEPWSAGSPLASPPGVTDYGGTLEVFWRGTNNHIWEAWYVANGGWNGPVGWPWSQ